MNRQKAYEAMKNGAKITHPNFQPNEYYWLLNDDVIDEKGYTHTRVFWSTAQNNWRRDNWELYKQ